MDRPSISDNIGFYIPSPLPNFRKLRIYGLSVRFHYNIGLLALSNELLGLPNEITHLALLSLSKFPMSRPRVVQNSPQFAYMPR